MKKILGKKVEKNIVYLCDRKKCENCTYQKCSHTSDINHAKNFKKYGQFYYEEQDVIEILKENEELRKIVKHYKDKEDEELEIWLKVLEEPQGTE